MVVVFLAVHFAVAVGSKRNESTTSDELAHLTAGFSYWQNHDYRLHPENGNLPQRWAALPAWLMGAKFPDLAGNDYWRTSDAWVIGHQFFYETGEDHFPRLMAGRAMIALFSVGIGILIFCWSRKFFGDAGGLLSLGFFAFCPGFLANGALVTSDVCMTFFFLAATGAWWRHLHAGNARSWWISALIFGLAFIAKYSAVLLLPVFAVMSLVRIGTPTALRLGGRTFTTPAGKLGAIVLSGIGHAVIACAVIWVFYGFRFSAFNPSLPPADHFIRPWAAMMGDIEAGRLIDAIARFRALPEGFLYGFGYVLNTVKVRAAFLNGDYSLTGWPSFFVWTFFLKTTLPVILACVGAIGLALLRWRSRGASTMRRDLYRLTPLLALFGVYWLFSVTSRLNIGHRHILPIYPILFIGLGAFGWTAFFQTRALRAAVIALLGWHAVEAASIAPHYLAYFNEIAGGPKNGRHHLVDSSLDWGQDLPGLATWLQKHGTGEPVFLSYFGTGEPAYYKIRARRIAFLNHFKFPVVYTPLEAGVYCISATTLSHVYSQLRGPWTLPLEDEYQQLRTLEATFERYTHDAAARADLEQKLSSDQWQAMIKRHDALRFARLCHYLRVRQPDAEVGYSIFIFRLSADEVARATAGSLADWSSLIEQTVVRH